ncbi:MAG: glycosyltransferase family 9 protein, partial [Candidatus Omnitrophota bacterium]
MKYVFKKKIYTAIFAMIDVIGNVVVFPFRRFRREAPVLAKKVLLVRVDHIGDVMTATAVLEPFKRRYPGAVIDFMAPVWAGDFLENDPFIDKHIVFNAPWFERGGSGFAAKVKGFFRMVRLIREGNYDAGIDLRGDFRHILAMFLAGLKCRVGYGITGGGFLLTRQVPYEGRLHEAERDMALLGPFGVKGRVNGVSLTFSAEDRKKSAEVLKEAGINGPYMVLHTVPGHASKNWSPDNFARLARYLMDKKKLDILMAGSAGDRGYLKDIIFKGAVGAIDISGLTNIGTLGAILEKASLFVGVDSGPAHISAAAGIPTIVLFSGANDPAQ